MSDPNLVSLAAALKMWAETTTSAAVTPEPAKYKDLTKIEFDWDTLRLMVNIKLANRPRSARDKYNDMGYKELARELGVSDHTVGTFCRGQKGAVTVDTAMRFMAWVGYTDFASFIKGETEDDDD